MKKSKETSKPLKSLKPGKPTVKAKLKVSYNKTNPAEEDIREKAMEIYLDRIEKRNYATPETDWIEAENYFRNNEE